MYTPYARAYPRRVNWNGTHAYLHTFATAAKDSPIMVYETYKYPKIAAPAKPPGLGEP